VGLEVAQEEGPVGLVMKQGERMFQLFLVLAQQVDAIVGIVE
jgi:hypothetical protein